MHPGQSHLSAKPPRPTTWPVAAVALLFCTLAGFTARAEALDPCAGHLDGALCSDGNPCTRNDTCQAGWCKGVVAADGTDCTDGNLCTAADRCVLGLCVGQTVPEGQACDDGNMCTTGELCSGGLCTPQGNLKCDDSNACTVDLCFPQQGCVFSPVVPPVQCIPPDGGAGGQGGNAGGAGGQGTGGQGSQGGTSQPDGGSFDGPLGDVADGPGGTGDGSLVFDAAGGTSDAAEPSIAYHVEGGAILCEMSPHARGRLGVLPWLGLAGLVFVRLRRARSRCR